MRSFAEHDRIIIFCASSSTFLVLLHLPADRYRSIFPEHCNSLGPFRWPCWAFYCHTSTGTTILFIYSSSRVQRLSFGREPLKKYVRPNKRRSKCPAKTQPELLRRSNKMPSKNSARTAPSIAAAGGQTSGLSSHLHSIMRRTTLAVSCHL